MKNIGVIGGGLMGSGISEVGARAGMSVVVVEITDAAAGAAKDRIRQSLEKAASRGKITEETAVATLERISFTTDLGMLKDRDLVVEAASEREDVKARPLPAGRKAAGEQRSNPCV